MMKNFSLAFLLLFVIHTACAQNSRSWKGYFSYNEITDISDTPAKLVASSENALFSKDILSGSVKTSNTIDGLSGQTISAIYNSPTYKKTMLGYVNGLLIISNDVDGTIINVVDIINKSIAPNIKRINHFLEFNGIVYISCDFGIVEYNLANMQFGDTFFIGNGAAQIAVFQTDIFENRIYAATGFGIRSALITNPNLNDFNQWTTLDANGWTGVQSIENKFYAVSNTGFLYTWNGANFVNPVSLLQPAADMRQSEDYLVLTTASNIYIYNSDKVQLKVINRSIIDLDAQFTCAAVIDDIIYMGTKENGIYSTGFNNSVLENLTPGGPVRNNVFSITATTADLWAVYGGYNISYDPNQYFNFTPPAFSISKYSPNRGWLEIPYEELFGAKAIVRITANPQNENLVYFSSYNNGLLKVENEVPSILYNENNSGLEALVPGQVRTNGTTFDAAGNLWVTNAGVDKALKILKPDNTWQAAESFAGLYDQLARLELGRLTIDKNGTKWISTRSFGLIGYNEIAPIKFKQIKAGDDNGNLPFDDVRVAAIDNRNQLWIGTAFGLRILPSVDSFLNGEPQLTTENIVIAEEQNEELLFEQFITDIVVDGSNNKWVATGNAGVFYLSSNGQRTIYQFNETNSPLPSNSVNDIDINAVTGEVFFATNRGMVSFKGISTGANDNLNNVFVYPNPVRPNFGGTVKVSGLVDKANVKIADIEGNLVYETTSEGGTIEWDTTAFGKYRVASGVYMIFISSDDALETKVKKVMIIR